MFTVFRKMLVPIVMLGMVTAYATDSSASTYAARLSKGQTVYVPAYSNVYSGPKKNPFQLATMLSIRNVDLSDSFKVTAIDYYDNDGRLIKRYAESSMIIGPLGSHHIYLEEKDTRGGFGANFIVRWTSEKTINIPIIECLMIGTTSGQGISFVSPGQEIKE